MTGRMLGFSLLLVAAPLAAQQRLTFYGGETRYEVGDMGARTSWLTGFAATFPVTRLLHTDVAVVAFDYAGGSFADGWLVAGTRVATELGVYLQTLGGWFRPYVGGGPGFSVSHRRINDAPARFGRVSETVHGAVGASFMMNRSWAIRLDVRARGIVGPGWTSDLTVGVTKRLATK
jgi:hypothetical protein